MNFGSGFDYKDGWTNVDVFRLDNPEGTLIWDGRQSATAYPNRWKDTFDFVLVNHVLCTMDYKNVDKVLKNLQVILKPEGKIQIIDMNLLLAFYAYQDRDETALPAGGDTIDEQLCNHISGYGTRKSLYTPASMMSLLLKHGFNNVRIVADSEHDLRPKESLILEATK